MLRTKRQRRILCRSCPIARTADIVGDSVSLLILRDLFVKPRGFTELELSLNGISSRTICNKLKKMEKSGLLLRVPKSAFYPRVDWRLTVKGRALRSVVEAMRTFGAKHL